MKRLGQYILLEKLRAGGMAEVYVGMVPGVEGFRKLVAIKRILPEVACNESFEKMLIDEARLTAQLSHASIAQTLDFGRQETELYLAMEYIAGPDLRRLQLRLAEQGTKLPFTAAAYIMQKVCEALDYAHKKTGEDGTPLGIVHRDVSPTNILVSFEGEVKLIDFGIARAKDRLVSTRAGLVKGKVRYMAPEYAMAGKIDGRADIFSAGVVLWELMTGKNLFQGDSDIVVLAKMREANFPKPTQVAPEAPWTLEKIVMKALARDPADRFQTAGEMATELGRWLALEPDGFSRENLSELLSQLFPDEIEKERQLLRKAAEVAELHAPPPKTEGRMKVLARDNPKRKRGPDDTALDLDNRLTDEEDGEKTAAEGEDTSVDDVPPAAPSPAPRPTAALKRPPGAGPKRPPPGAGPRRPPPSAGPRRPAPAAARRRLEPEPEPEEHKHEEEAEAQPARPNVPLYVWVISGGTLVALALVVLLIALLG